MSFFNRKPKTNKQYNRFASHVDVLQRMANSLSQRAIEAIKCIIKFNSESGAFERNLRISIEGSFLEVDFLEHYYLSIPDSFGMEPIAKYEWSQFMDALYPHFKTIFYDQFTQTVSDKSCSVNVVRSNYIKEDFDYDDNLIRLVYPSIEISFKGGKETERPILRKW